MPSTVPLAVMVATPAVCPVTSPLLPSRLLTVAISGWLLCHWTRGLSVTSNDVPSDRCAVAVKASCSPTGTVPSVGCSSSRVTKAELILSCSVASRGTPLMVPLTLMVLPPCASPVTSPVSLMLATAGSLLLQLRASCSVTSMGALPSDRLAKALSCALIPTGSGSCGAWISSPVITASVTSSGAEAWIGSPLTVATASRVRAPTANPVASPLLPSSLLTCARLSSLLYQLRAEALVTSRDWPSEKLAVATKAWLKPTGTVALAGVSCSSVT
ncbi:hypothetical protein D3C78_937540 [compost metagenome]